MSTKDHCWSSSKQLSYNNGTSSHDNQYSNLNLNSGSRSGCLKPVQSESGFGFQNKSGNDVADRNQHGARKDSTFWAKNQLSSSPKLTYKQILNPNAQKSKGNGSSDSELPVSELSLQIAAYQKEHENDEIIDMSSSSIKGPFCKSWQDVKKAFSESASPLKAAFEIPRQQKGGPLPPEVMQFKASQQLLNPNAQHGLACGDSTTKNKRKRKKHNWDQPEVQEILWNHIERKNPKTAKAVAELLMPYLGETVSSSTLNDKIHSMVQMGKKKIENKSHGNAYDPESLAGGNRQMGGMLGIAFENLRRRQDAVLDAFRQELSALAKAAGPVDPKNVEPSCSKDYIPIENDFDFDDGGAESHEDACVHPAASFEPEDNGPSKKRRKLVKNKIQIMKYNFALNERLEEKMLQVEEGDFMIEYLLKNTKGTTRHYECSRCKSIATLYGDGDLWANPHLSTCNLTFKEQAHAWQIEKRIKKLVTQGVKIRDAYQIGKSDCDKAGTAVYYKPYGKIRKQLSRMYGKQLRDCKIGQTAEEFKSFAITGTRWLLKETAEYAIFSTDKMLKVMAEAMVLVVDGTFSIRPKEAEKGQILTIHALVGTETGEEWVPVCMAVLTSHEQSQYEAVVDAIKEKWAELRIKPSFGRIHCDYEDGLMNAMKQLDTPEKVYGCDFHSSQAIYRALVQCNLYRPYMDGKKKSSKYNRIRTWLRDILALPLLQKNEIQWYWKKVLQYPPKAAKGETDWPTAEMEKFKNYIEKNWISRIDNSWTFFGLYRVRNTNRAESYHSAGKQIFSQRPKYKVFVYEQRMFFAQAETRIQQLEMGDNVIGRSWKYEKLDTVLHMFEQNCSESLQKATTDDARSRILRLHLRRVSRLLHDIRNKSTNTKKSGKSTNVKYAAIKDAKLELTHDEQLALMYDTIMDQTLKEVDGPIDETNEESEDEEDEMVDIHDIEISKIYDDETSVNVEGLNEVIYSDSDDDDICGEMEDFDGDNSLMEAGMEQLYEESDFHGPEKDKLHHNLSPPSTVPPATVPQASAMPLKPLNAKEKEEKTKQPTSDDVEHIEDHPLFNKFSNPPTEEWCRNACDKLNLPFQNYLHPAEKGLNIALCVPADSFNVASDGNCGYSTAAVLVAGSPDGHVNVRGAIADYVLSEDIPNIDALQPGSRGLAVQKRQPVSTNVLRRIGTGQHLWFESDDMAILSHMLDVNIICWVETTKYWYWFHKSMFYNLNPHAFDQSKPTIFMRQIGQNHFGPVFRIRYLADFMPRQIPQKPSAVNPNADANQYINHHSAFSTSDSGEALIVGEVKLTNEQQMNLQHHIYPCNPPSKQWLLKNASKFKLPFSSSIFSKLKPVDDIYYHSPATTIPTEMDGHCGFHSASTIFTGEPKHHGLIRTMLARHILANANELRKLPFWEDARSLAIADLGVNPNKSTTFWMKSIHLAAVADLFECNVLVKRRERHGWTCYNSTTFLAGCNRTEHIPHFPTVLIDNASEYHFEPITSLKQIL